MARHPVASGTTIRLITGEPFDSGRTPTTTSTSPPVRRGEKFLITGEPNDGHDEQSVATFRRVVTPGGSSSRVVTLVRDLGGGTGRTGFDPAIPVFDGHGYLNRLIIENISQFPVLHSASSFSERRYSQPRRMSPLPTHRASPICQLPLHFLSGRSATKGWGFWVKEKLGISLLSTSSSCGRPALFHVYPETVRGRKTHDGATATGPCLGRGERLYGATNAGVQFRSPNTCSPFSDQFVGRC